MFYDDSVSEHVADSIHRVLSRKAAIAMIRIEGVGQIKNLFKAVEPGQKFLIISRKNNIREFINVVSFCKF